MRDGSAGCEVDFDLCLFVSFDEKYVVGRGDAVAPLYIPTVAATAVANLTLRGSARVIRSSRSSSIRTRRFFFGTYASTMLL